MDTPRAHTEGAEMAKAIDWTPGKTVVLVCTRGAKRLKNAKSDDRYDANPAALIAAYGGHKFRTTSTMRLDERGQVTYRAEGTAEVDRCPTCDSTLEVAGQVRGTVTTKKCSPSCGKSEGFECFCECGGANHGALA
jgi:hypothetical protein